VCSIVSGSDFVTSGVKLTDLNSIIYIPINDNESAFAKVKYIVIFVKVCFFFIYRKKDFVTSGVKL